MSTPSNRRNPADGRPARRSTARKTLLAASAAFLTVGIIGAPSALAAPDARTYELGLWVGIGAEQTRVGYGTLVIEAGENSGRATADTDPDTDWVGTWTVVPEEESFGREGEPVQIQLTRTTAAGTPETLVADVRTDPGQGDLGGIYTRDSAGVRVEQGFLGTDDGPQSPENRFNLGRSDDE